jgi:hypothetical protein
MRRRTRLFRSSANPALPYIMRFMSFTLVTCPSTCPLLICRVNPAWTAALSCSTPEAKRLSFGEKACLDLGQPGVEPLPFTPAQHLEKVLRQAIGRRKSRMRLAKSHQVHSFAFIQVVWMSHEEAHRSA